MLNVFTQVGEGPRVGKFCLFLFLEKRVSAGKIQPVACDFCH